jgi:EAL domain-containing protein (putative c-di-GMP-specific phosphodiesterase class I)
MQWISRLHQALAEGRFCLYYQPIVPIGQGVAEQHGEILLRLLDERGVLVLPGVFIPPAERYQQMFAVDCWVIRTVFAMLHTRPSTQPLVGYAINISGQSLSDEAFLDFVIEQLNQTGIPPGQICFEITETAAVTNFTSAIRFISALRNRGCRFALDDFGSGLCSFAYLKNLPVDYLKIDGSFVKDIVNDPIDYAMVEAINRIGHVMGIKTIAESMENPAILEKLKIIGVDYVQGYGIAKPRHINELETHWEIARSAR